MRFQQIPNVVRALRGRFQLLTARLKHLLQGITRPEEPRVARSRFDRLIQSRLRCADLRQHLGKRPSLRRLRVRIARRTTPELARGRKCVRAGTYQANRKKALPDTLPVQTREVLQLGQTECEQTLEQGAVHPRQLRR